MEDRRYSDEEFALILRKAGDLQDSRSDVSGGLTLEEMKAAAREVGIDPGLVERAAALVPKRTGPTTLERIAGGPLHYNLEQYVPVTIDEESAGRALQAIREAARHFGAVEQEPSGFAWRSVSEPSQMLVTATRDGDRTRLRVSADRSGGLMLTGFLNLMAGTITAMITGAVLDPSSGAVGAAIVGAGLAGGLTSARLFWKASSRTVKNRLDAMMDALRSELGRD